MLPASRSVTVALNVATDSFVTPPIGIVVVPSLLNWPSPVGSSGGRRMLNCTDTRAGLLIAPGDVTMTVSLCVPACKFAGLSDTVIVPGALAEPGESPSQLDRCAAESRQASTPPSPFATVRVAVLVGETPSVAVSLTVPGVTESTGCRMKNCTGTLIGLLVAT